MKTPWNGRLDEFLNDPAYSTKTPYRQRIIEEISERMQHASKPDRWVLDYGCGIGTLRRYMPTAINYIGVDYTQDFIEHCEKTYGSSNAEFHLVRSPVDCRPLSVDHDIGLVNTTSVLNHCHDWKDVLKELMQLTQEYIVLFQPENHETTLLRVTEFGVPLYRIAIGDIEKVLYENGFETELVEKMDHVGPKGGVTPCALIVGKKTSNINAS